MEILDLVKRNLLSKGTVKRIIDKSKIGRKYVQVIYLRKDTYLKSVKNSPNSIVRKQSTLIKKSRALRRDLTKDDRCSAQRTCRCSHGTHRSSELLRVAHITADCPVLEAREHLERGRCRSEWKVVQLI